MPRHGRTRAAAEDLHRQGPEIRPARPRMGRARQADRRNMTPEPDFSDLRAASSASGGTEMLEDALGVVRFPGFAGLTGGVVLVEGDEQIGQLTADWLGAQ